MQTTGMGLRSGEQQHDKVPHFLQACESSLTTAGDRAWNGIIVILAR